MVLLAVSSDSLLVISRIPLLIVVVVVVVIVGGGGGAGCFFAPTFLEHVLFFVGG